MQMQGQRRFWLQRRGLGGLDRRAGLKLAGLELVGTDDLKKGDTEEAIARWRERILL